MFTSNSWCRKKQLQNVDDVHNDCQWHNWIQKFMTPAKAKTQESVWLITVQQTTRQTDHNWPKQSRNEITMTEAIWMTKMNRDVSWSPLVFAMVFAVRSFPVVFLSRLTLSLPCNHQSWPSASVHFIHCLHQPFIFCIVFWVFSVIEVNLWPHYGQFVASLLQSDILRCYRQQFHTCSISPCASVRPCTILSRNAEGSYFSFSSINTAT